MSRTIFPALAHPVTKQVPVSDTRHGIRRIDEYAWLRADNWSEMFKDSSKLAPEIRTHLEAENSYQAALIHSSQLHLSLGSL